MDDPRKDATAITREANAAVIDRLPFEDKRDFEEATRGFIAPLADGPILKDDGAGSSIRTG